MSEDIQPTIDEHGVGWCSGCDCPHNDQIVGCDLASIVQSSRGICEPWARRIVAEREQIIDASGFPPDAAVSLVQWVRGLADTVDASLKRKERGR